MTAKFDSFVAELKELCRKHEVSISTSGYDHIQVWDAKPEGESPIYLDAIEDETSGGQ